MGKSDAYIVNPDGSITETVSNRSLDEIISAFIRVAAHQPGKRTAYKAQQKAIKYLKKHSDCEYPDTYVKDFELKNYPKEFYRAELGRNYNRLVWLASILWISFIGLLGYYWIFKEFKRLNAEFNKLNS